MSIFEITKIFKLFFLGFILVLCGTFLYNGVVTANKSHQKELKSELVSYNKKHNTNYKDVSDVKETVTYTGTFVIKTVEDDKSILDYVIGYTPTHNELTYTSDSGSKITTRYTGNLDEGVYKDGKVIVTINPITNTRKVVAYETR